MDGRVAALRAEISDWRDDQTLATMRLVMATSREAAVALEGHSSQVGWVEAFQRPASAAQAIVRPVMRERLAPALRALAIRGAGALRRLDASLEPLAASFEQDAAQPGRLAADMETPNSAADPGSDDAPLLPDLGLSSVQQHVEASSASPTSPSAAGALVGQLGDWLDKAAVALDQGARDMAGVRGWLRTEGTAELRGRWTGLAQDDEPSLLSELLAVIDATAEQARERLA